MQGRQKGSSGGTEEPGRRVVWGAFTFFFIFEGGGGTIYPRR